MSKRETTVVRVAINGAAGRMGRRLVDLISREPGMQVVAALEQAGHPDLGKDAGELAGAGKLGHGRAVRLDGARRRAD